MTYVSLLNEGVNLHQILWYLIATAFDITFRTYCNIARNHSINMHTQLFSYPGDTRPEFKMWGGASKSVFVLVLKICHHQFASKTLSC